MRAKSAGVSKSAATRAFSAFSNQPLTGAFSAPSDQPFTGSSFATYASSRRTRRITNYINRSWWSFFTAAKTTSHGFAH